MVPRKLEIKKGNLMAATWTKAAVVRRAFKSGRQRQKDLLLTPTRAILEGSIVLHELQTAMRDAGLLEEDAKAALVFVSDAGSSDLIYVAPLPEVEGLANLSGKIKALQGVWRPLGLVFWQRDREAEIPGDPKSGAVGWVQPWLTDQRSARALIAARDVVSKGQDGQQSFN